MTHSFDGPHTGPHVEGFGFGAFDPHTRRAMHQARRELKAHLKDHAFNHGGFGPGGFGFGGPRGGGRRGRGRRGDVRAAILALLADRPMHGYEMIQEIGSRSNGLWRPSPGSVYPTLQLLVDEGLIVEAESAGSKRLFELTDEGRDAAGKASTPPWEEIADGVGPDEVNLRSALGPLAAAIFQASQAATPAQQKRIVEVVNNTRKQIYGILGED